jgi:hypothetical protein
MPGANLLIGVTLTMVSIVRHFAVRRPFEGFAG